MARDNIAQTVKDYILEEFLAGEKPEALDGSTPLITGGVLDSLSTIRLVTFLEEHYGIEFDAHEMSPAHLDTLDQIAQLVETKVTAK